MDSGWHVQRITRWPRDFPPLADGVTQGLLPFYGVAGCEMYRQQAPGIFGAYLGQPELRWWAAMAGERMAAVVLTRLHHGRGELTLAHRCLPKVAREAEEGLVLHAVNDLRSRGAACVLAEFMPTSSFAGLKGLEGAGFQHFARAFMECPIAEEPMAAGAAIRSLRPGDTDAAGSCIAAAYRATPERLLHRETHSPEQAAGLVQRVLLGEFGTAAAGMNVGIWQGHQCVAVALGCVLAPGIGFTIQVATAPAAQGRRYAPQMLMAQQRAFHEAGCTRATLAVTTSNTRAKELYERLGYRIAKDFDAYVWYREGTARAEG